jgi:hypothetical protein
MIQPNEFSQEKATALPTPNDMILKWAEERPDEVYLNKTNN